jgi:hypothetical protein
VITGNAFGFQTEINASLNLTAHIRKSSEISEESLTIYCPNVIFSQSIQYPLGQKVRGNDEFDLQDRR